MHSIHLEICAGFYLVQVNCWQMAALESNEIKWKTNATQFP